MPSLVGSEMCIRDSSFVACCSRLTIDRASLSRRSTVPTPNGDTPPTFGRSFLFFSVYLSVCESTFLEIYFFKNCPEGKICGKFLKQRQKCTLSKVGFDKSCGNFCLCFVGLQRTEHLSEAERLCNGLYIVPQTGRAKQDKHRCLYSSSTSNERTED